MGKDKTKKKKKKGEIKGELELLDIENAEELEAIYIDSLSLLEAKHQQADGLIAEMRITLNEIKGIRDSLKQAYENNDFNEIDE